MEVIDRNGNLCPIRIIERARVYEMDWKDNFNYYVMLIRAENHLAEHIRKLSKRHYAFSSPYGTWVTCERHERTLYYHGSLITITRYMKDDGPRYVTGHCHYNRGENHKTLRGAIYCAKQREDRKWTWNHGQEKCFEKKG